jgi:cell division protein FtsL
MWFLVTALVVTALSVVFVRHQHRIAYTALHAEESRRDALNDEWGQLLIEENLWAFPHRIERDASQQLSMRPPVSDEVVFVEPDNALEVAHASR